MKRIGILYHPLKEAARVLSSQLEDFLISRGISVWRHSAWDWETARPSVDGTDLLLTVGGDGTILRAAQLTAGGPTPITGINLGRLGFMTELSVNETMGKLLSLLDGKGWVDERCLLETELYPEEGKGPSHRLHALNDVVVARAGQVRIVNVDVDISGAPLTTYRADGVIVATATGSTGYALAAGGPVMHPQARELLLLPILPHLCSGYSLVLPSGAQVGLRLTSYLPAVLSIDGHINLPLSGGAVVRVRRSASTVRFLRIHPEASFYGTLEERLKGNRSIDNSRES